MAWKGSHRDDRGRSLMVLTETQAVPMQADRDGFIRVGGTRVRLETVIFAFHEGCIPEEIVSQYPALKRYIFKN